jgi:hypothetical protein
LSGLRLLDGSGQRNAAANSSGGESDR